MAKCDWHNIGFNARRILLLILIIPFANGQLESFDFPKFTTDSDLKQLKLEGDAYVTDSGIQLTNIVDSNTNLTTRVGRIINPQPFHLWNKTSNKLKDFTTQFSFTIFSSNQDSHGDGIAFFLASQNLTKLNDTTKVLRGGGIGIGHVDNTTSLQTEYQFVAIEFDTFSNHWDPRGAHVGVNINSMVSDILEGWSPQISGTNIVYDCIIQYISEDSYLTVSLTSSGFNEGVVTQYLAYQVNLSDHLPDYVLVGISAAKGYSSEEHTLLSWSFSTSLIVSSNDETKKGSKLLLEGIGTGAGFCVSLIGLFYALLWRTRKNRKEEEEQPFSETASDLNMDDEFLMNTGPKKISYCELVSATNNFEEGGSGYVYKGYLKEFDSYAAIKKISVDSIEEYEVEVKVMSQLRHKNLMKLNGWCHKKNDLLLIYEYMSNGSLDSNLFYGERFLSWQVRYNVVLGLASALLYLHEEWEKCVIHRDVKSSNIMLDSNFNPRLGGFGLAMLVDHEKVSQSQNSEYINTDIFNFGVVLLEVVSGRKAILHQELKGEVSLVELVLELYRSGDILEVADPKLCGVFDVKQMECLLIVGLWCANPNCISRPCTRQVIKVLNFEVALPILP
ncbi:L-type lectin-domain containing receptor kinase IX.1-like [Cicer arietinum]|uniref:L-type lectin-domain containing receptor kinase IX.1-like n=1 Tax=Cicer arietinum TaxID=3827 RepID=A0A1S2YIE2_CICAR|nr:L-type lectin-domain containing receptor kinase IX.1-like [Cicer arietinum]